MSQATLGASLTRAKGSRNARRLRASGSIPAVVYGGGAETLAGVAPGEAGMSKQW